MNELRKIYFSMQMTLFPMSEEEKLELSPKMREFLEVIEMVQPSRFLNGFLFWSGWGRPMKDREPIIRAFMLKSVYNLPTTKMLLETLRNSSNLRRLCGWETAHQVSSEATFSRTFKVLAEK